MLRSNSKRKGATLVEFAIVAPVIFLLILFMIVGAMGVFRYQEVSHLAREATRYATVHGGWYAADGMPAKTGEAAIASDSDIQAFVIGRAVALDTSKLTSTAVWSAPPGTVPINIPSFADPDPTLVPPGQKLIRNYITVTVTYQWTPEFYLIGPINLSSTSKAVMAY
jgi:Flp pilus assembly protein TadG